MNSQNPQYNAEQFFKLMISSDADNDIKSNFSAAVEDARKLTGRSLDGKNIIDPDRTGNWTGNLIYLCLIDLLAECFGTNRNGNRLKFTEFLIENKFSRDDASAIYALRCSFAHEFGLANKAVNSNLTSYIFELYAKATSDTVTLAASQWHGRYENITDQMITRVNLQRLADNVECLIADLEEKAKLGNLVLKVSPVEFSVRFFIRAGHTTQDVKQGCLGHIFTRMREWLKI